MVLSDSLCDRKSQLEARKKKWEAEYDRPWGSVLPEGERDLLTAMVKILHFLEVVIIEEN